MALIFPQNPTNGQIYGQYIFDSASGTWKIYDNEYGLIDVLATKANLSGGNTFSGNQIFSNTVRISSQPVFWAYKTTTQSSFADVVYDVATTNIGSHYNTSNGRFTAPVAGTYLFFSNTIGANTASTTRLYFKKNGSFFPTSATQHRTANTSNFSTASEFTFIFTLAAGDYVNLYLSEATLYGESNPYSIFGGYLIG